jgi:hypothetical protein
MIATDITQAIYKSYEQEFNGEFRSHLGASIGGDPCLRKLWYKFRNTKMVNFEGRMLKLFQRGHREEFMFIDDLRRAGIHITNEDENGNQFRLGSTENKHVSGSSDGFGECQVDTLPSLNKGEWILAEMKTHGERSFKKLEKEGLVSSKPLHYSQMQLYMKWSQLTKALYIAVNKNTDHIHIELIDFDSEHADSTEQRMISVVEADVAPPKLHHDPSRFECKYCDFSDVCHTKKYKLQVNCRTCLFAKTQADGTWLCRKNSQVLEDTKPCEQHLFSPSFLDSFKEGQRAPNEDTILYKLPNGLEIGNGISDPQNNIYSSHELSAIIEGGIDIYTEGFKLIEKAFDGKVVCKNKGGAK